MGKKGEEKESPRWQVQIWRNYWKGRNNYRFSFLRGLDRQHSLFAEAAMQWKLRKQIPRQQMMSGNEVREEVKEEEFQRQIKTNDGGEKNIFLSGEKEFLLIYS